MIPRPTAPLIPLIPLALALGGGCSGTPPKPTPTPEPSYPPSFQGCAANTDGIGSIDPLCCHDDPTLTITTGDTEIVEAMPDGYESVMIHGPQGGWHIFSGVITTHMRSVVAFDVTVTVPSLGDAVIADNHFYVGVLTEDPCDGIYPQMTSFLDVRALASGEKDTPPEILAGLTAIITAVAEDSDGRGARASVQTVLVPDPIDVMTPTPTAPDASPTQSP